jgi:hypothetical protein
VDSTAKDDAGKSAVDLAREAGNGEVLEAMGETL